MTTYHAHVLLEMGIESVPRWSVRFDACEQGTGSNVLCGMLRSISKMSVKSVRVC